MEKNKHMAARTHRQRQQRVRSAIFAVIVISVLGLPGYYLKSAFFRPAPPTMSGNVIDVQADMSGFDQNEIRIKIGQPVTVRLISLDNFYHTDGGGKHQWAGNRVSTLSAPDY